MNKDAYLVAWIDTERLKVRKVSIYSEPHPTPGKERWQPATLADAPGVSYEDAKRRLCEQIAHDYARKIGPRDIGWVWPFLSNDLQALVRSIACPHCLQPLVKEPLWCCSGCGLRLVKGAQECPKCGRFEGNLGLVQE